MVCYQFGLGGSIEPLFIFDVFLLQLDVSEMLVSSREKLRGTPGQKGRALLQLPLKLLQGRIVILAVGR